MTETLGYASQTPLDADRSHLRTLAICHYVWGGIVMAFSSVFIIYVVVGFLIASGSIPSGSTSGVSPTTFGYLLALIGAMAVLIGWTVGILTIYSGRCLARQRNRTFSIVMACINCLSIPIGTTLGVFTLVVLFRQSVTQMYLANAAAPPYHA